MNSAEGEGQNDWILQVVLGIDCLFFIFNASIGIYIVLGIMLPHQLNYKLLWTFYIFAILSSLIACGLAVTLIFEVDKMENCYIYQKDWVSVFHSIMTASVVACGYIAAATMHQIRVSLQVIL